jgi:DNA-binding CsgD family transcriptional regulator
VHLDAALALAEPTGELMRLGPVRIARAEAAWLTGDPELAAAEAMVLYDEAHRSREYWMAGHMALWLHRAGRPVDTSRLLPEPIALEIAGQGRQAAAFWQERGFPLESARALAGTGDEEALREALVTAERLGAKPDAARMVRALRQIGATSIPRGPRPTTQANPAGLTARELEILPLLAQGQTNREIADALFLSPRTVGHHVSAILGKLEVPSRTGVKSRAEHLGLLPV